MEIRNSDWPETFTVIFFQKISFLAAKEERQPPYGGLMRVGGTPRGVRRAPYLVTTSGTVSRGFFFRNFPNIPKNKLRPFLSRLDSV